MLFTVGPNLPLQPHHPTLLAPHTFQTQTVRVHACILTYTLTHSHSHICTYTHKQLRLLSRRVNPPEPPITRPLHHFMTSYNPSFYLHSLGKLLFNIWTHFKQHFLCDTSPDSFTHNQLFLF